MKTALITGASSGIGKEAAAVFARNGYNLVLAARRMEKLSEVKTEIEKQYQVHTELIEIDLSEMASADRLYTAIKEKNITIDVLINNAGFGLSGNFIDIDLKKETEMLMLNMITLTRMTKLFAGDMIKKNGGIIINLASTASFQPVPGMACYGATKSYVLNFTEAIAYELRKTNVKVIAICPGATESEFSKVAGVEKSKMFQSVPTSKELAEFIFKAMTTSRYYKMHGFKNRFLKTASTIAPRKMVIGITARLIKNKKS